MNLNKLIPAKSGVNTLIKTVAKASTGDVASDIESNSRIEIVSFATDAIVYMPLSINRAHMRTALAILRGGGKTNHTPAFQTAERLLKDTQNKRRIAVILTDGLTTVEDDAERTGRMKAESIEIYYIRLADDLPLLTQQAIEPYEKYVSSTNRQSELDDLFTNIAFGIFLARTKMFS